MKNEWMITFRSVTYAQRGQRALQRAGIRNQLHRTPRDLSERGCGYCLRLRGWEAPKAVEVLRQEGISYEKLYAIREDGTPQERAL